MNIKQIQRILKRGAIDKEEIKAVHDDDLENFLRSIGLLNDMESEKIHCKFCNEKITMETLQAIFPDSGSINVICNHKSCIKNFADYYESIK